MRNRWKGPFITAASLAVLAACAETATFVPVDNVAASGHGGQPAAGYEIRDAPDADAMAEVNVWSRGAVVEDGTTFVDLAISIMNRGDQALELEGRELRLEAFANDGGKLPAPRLVAATDPALLVVPPGAARDVYLRYALPIAFDPDHISSLRLRWVLDRKNGGQYTQFTEFQRVRDPYYPAGGYYYSYNPVFGYYDPFIYPQAYSYRYPVQRVVVVEREPSPATVTRP